MNAALFFTVLALLAALYYLGKFALAMYVQKRQAEADFQSEYFHSRLKDSQLQHKERELQIINNMAKEIKKGAKAAGLNEAYQMIMPQMQKLAEIAAEDTRQYFTANLDFFGEARYYEMNAGVSRKNNELLKATLQRKREEHDKLVFDLKRIQHQRDQASKDAEKYKKEAERFRKALVRGNNEGLEETPMPGQDTETTLIRPLNEASTRGLRGNNEGIDWGDFVYVFENNENHRFREEIQNGYKGVVSIIDVETEEAIDTFNARDLVPGQVHVLPNSGIKVILCALEGCMNVKFTNQINTKCCSREHTDKMNNEKKKQAV